MKIVVCIKPVPDPQYYDQIKIDPQTKRIVRAGIPSVLSNDDLRAISFANQLKQDPEDKIIALTMAAPEAQQQLREVLARGCDQAILLSDRLFAGADTYSTSYTLSAALKQIGDFDIVIAGNASSDGATSHVPSQIGEWLKLPHAANVLSVKNENTDHLVVTKQLENGNAKYRLKLPCVLGIAGNKEKPPYLNVRSILEAVKKPLLVWKANDIKEIDTSRFGLSGSPSQAGELETANSTNKECELFEGTSQEIADQIFNILRPTIGSREV